MAASLAAGDGAMPGGEAALDEYGLDRRRSQSVVVLIDRSFTPMDGVEFIRTRTLSSEDRTTWNGHAFPTIERVLVDVAHRRSVHHLCKLISEAAFRKLLDVDRLRRTIQRNRNHKGIGRLIDALARYEGGENGVDSKKEERLARMFARAGITDVRFNVWMTIHGTKIRVDAFIESANVVIELDPDHHLRPNKTREDSYRTSLCRSVDLHTIRICEDAMQAGVDEVAAYVRSR